jgi:hypothetical protein
VDRFEPNLRIPGPTALPPSVREVGARQMINHRGPEFAAMLARILDGMKPFFGTAHDVAMLSCAGTGGLEAAIVNTLSPGDRVLGVSIGAFGDRFAKIAAAYGADVTKLDVAWGRAADPVELRARLAADGPFAAVLLTHNETSTGVMNPIPELAAAVRDAAADALILVCGRYEGVDERVLAYVDEELSIGDYVLAGGEAAAFVIIDAVTRLLPGFVGNPRSLAEESFQTGLLEYPQYTRPETFRAASVPAVLLSGDHAAIAEWRRQRALERTRDRRPDLLDPRD